MRVTLLVIYFGISFFFSVPRRPQGGQAGAFAPLAFQKYVLN